MNKLGTKLLFNGIVSVIIFLFSTFFVRSQVADFEVSSLEGCDPFIVDIFNIPPGGDSYIWDFDDGTSIVKLDNTPFSHTYTISNPGALEKFDLELTYIKSGVTTTKTIRVTANRTVAPDSISYSVRKGCSPLVVDFWYDDNSGDAKKTYWDFNEDGIADDTINNPSYTFVGIAPGIDTIIVSLAVENSYGCLLPVYQPITLYTLNTIAGSDTSICGLDYSFNASNPVGAGSWIQVSGPGTAMFDDNTSNTTNVSVNSYGNYVFRWDDVVPTCSYSDDIQITFDTIPVADFSIPSDNCSSEAVSPVNLSTGSSNYLWDFGDGSAADTTYSPVHIYPSVPAGQDTVFTISLTTTNGAGCGTSVITRDITIHGKPLADFTSDVTEGCSPLTVNFTNLSSGSLTYRWDFGDGSAIDITSDAVHTFTVPEGQDIVYTVSLTATSSIGCDSVITRDITVHGKPVADFTSDITEGCSPLTVNFTNLSTGSSTYSWDYGDGSALETVTDSVHTFTAPVGKDTVYTVALIATSDTGCGDSVITRDITIQRKPIADFTSDIAEGCSPLTVNFANLSSGSSGFSWSYGDGSVLDTATNPVHTFTVPDGQDTVYSVSLTATISAGCDSVITRTITVHGYPISSFTADITEGCSPFTANFTNTSIGAVSYQWDFDEDGFTDDTSINSGYTFSGPVGSSLATVSLISESSFGCSNSSSTVITIHNIPADAGVDTIVCGTDYIFSASAALGAGTWSLISGPGTGTFDNANSNTAAVTVTDTGTYVFRWEDVTPFCTYSDEMQVTFQPLPTANFTVPSDICYIALVSTVNISSGSSTYLWDFGDGSTTETLTNPTHSYLVPDGIDTTYTITLTATSGIGCGDSVISGNINVHGKPVGDFTPDVTEGCSPLTVNFTNQSTGSSTYIWDYGDGSAMETVTDAVHTFTVPDGKDTVYTVSLTATSFTGCGDSVIIRAITVHGKPVSDFEPNLTEGCSPLDVSFSNRSLYSESYQWDFNNDGIVDDTSINPAHTFLTGNPGLVLNTVSLYSETSFGCRDTSNSVIRIFNMPPNAGDDEEVCGMEYRFNASSPAGVGNWSLVSSPGIATFNNSNLDTATVEVVVPGTYVFRWYDVTTYCDGYDDISLTFHKLPEPDFEVSKTLLAFPEKTIGVSNLTEGFWGFEWDFGDGSDKIIGEVEEYTYSSPGEYFIALLAYDQFCNDSAMKKIAVLPSIPVADFSADTAVCIGEEIAFENRSENGVNYLWIFGEEGFSQEFEPKYVFKNAGEHIVTLMILNEVNQKSEFSEKITVYPLPEAYFEIEEPIVLLPGGLVEPINKSVGASVYSWDFGDGYIYNDFQPAHEYTSPGQYNVCLSVISENNCIDKYTKSGSIIVSNSGALKVPNVFNPGDHNPIKKYGIATLPRDKYFAPVVLEGFVVEYSMKIFNRWGNMVYMSNNIDDGWDGFYKGALSSQDVYIWQIRARFDNGEEFEGTGDVTLVR